MNRQVCLSPQLSELLGAPALSRPEAVKRLWGHCREKGMLNPGDKREIVFDDGLREMFGRDRARMCDLFGMLMPHFDYAAQLPEGTGVKLQPKQEKCPVKRLLKGEPVAVKRQAKGERFGIKGERTVKNERTTAQPTKQEVSTVKRQCKGEVHTKAERTGDAVQILNVAVDLVDDDVQSVGAVKLEAPTPFSRLDLHEVAAGLVPELRHIGPATVAVECRLEERVIAAAVRFAVRAVARRRCADGFEQVVVVENATVDFREAANDSFLPFGQATLSGLDPALAYRVSLEVSDATGTSACSPEVALPQRATPVRWSADEVMQWCTSLDIPLLTEKAREYGFTGATLFGLREDDLKGLGLTDPLVIRRFLVGIRDLKAGGA